jgi:hypothetical protein
MRMPRAFALPLRRFFRQVVRGNGGYCPKLQTNIPRRQRADGSINYHSERTWPHKRLGPDGYSGTCARGKGLNHQSLTLPPKNLEGCEVYRLNCHV